MGYLKMWANKPFEAKAKAKPKAKPKGKPREDVKAKRSMTMLVLKKVDAFSEGRKGDRMVVVP